MNITLLTEARYGNIVVRVLLDEDGTLLLHLTPGIVLAREIFAQFIPDMTLELHVSMSATALYESRNVPDWTTEELRNYFEEFVPKLARFLHLLAIGDPVAAFSK